MHCVKLLLLLVMCNSIQAFIYDVQVYKKNGQTVIACGDFHGNDAVLNAQQRKQLINELVNCQGRDVKVIVEDLSFNNAGAPARCESYAINSGNSLLRGFVPACKQAGLLVENVEHRVCRVVSLGPVVNNLKQSPNRFPSTRMKMSKLLREIDVAMGEVKQLCNNKKMKFWYNSCVEKVRKKMNELQLSSYDRKTVAQYITDHEEKKGRFNVINTLLTFDSELIDARLLHKIVNDVHQCTVVIAGGSHITRIHSALKRHGYRHVYRHRVKQMRENDVRKCFGPSVVNGRYCVRPRPVDVTMIRKWL